MATQDFVKINQMTLHAIVEGHRHGLTLVFINSLGCDFRIWSGVTPHFVSSYRIVRYDKRGHGLSDCPPAPYKIRDHTDDLHGLLNHLMVGDVVLVGLSVGGLIALDYASQHTGRVRALVLSDTAARIGTAAYWNERISILREHGIAHLAEAILSRWFAPVYQQTQPAAYQGYGNMLRRMPLEGYVATCAAIRDADLRPQLARITMPALVLCGEEDAATLPEQVHELAKHLPDARFEMIPGAGHLPPVEQPAAVSAAIERFLKEVL